MSYQRWRDQDTQSKGSEHLRLPANIIQVPLKPHTHVYKTNEGILGTEQKRRYGTRRLERMVFTPHRQIFLKYTHIKKKLPLQNERMGSGDDVVLMTRDGDETILSTYVDI